MADRPVRIPIEAEIDLHAFEPGDIPSVVEAYIEAAAAAELREVRLIHGRGRGVQRGIVQAALDRHPRVTEFWDDADSHLGATVAILSRGPTPIADAARQCKSVTGPAKSSGRVRRNPSDQ